MDSVDYKVMVEENDSTMTLPDRTRVPISVDYKVMGEENHSTMTLPDRTRVPIRGRGSYGVLGQVYSVPEKMHFFLLVRQIDRKGVSTTFSEGVCVRCE